MAQLSGVIGLFPAASMSEPSCFPLPLTSECLGPVALSSERVDDYRVISCPSVDGQGFGVVVYLSNRHSLASELSFVSWVGASKDSRYLFHYIVYYVCLHLKAGCWGHGASTIEG